MKPAIIGTGKGCAALSTFMAQSCRANVFDKRLLSREKPTQHGRHLTIAHDRPGTDIHAGDCSAIQYRFRRRQSRRAYGPEGRGHPPQVFQSASLLEIDGPFAFVHAGIRPDRSINKQERQDCLSIRKPFLEYPERLSHPYRCTWTHHHGRATPACHPQSHRTGHRSIWDRAPDNAYYRPCFGFAGVRVDCAIGNRNHCRAH
jgi:hypothetical protein